MKPHPIRATVARAPSPPVDAEASSSGRGAAATILLVALTFAAAALLIVGARLRVRVRPAAGVRPAVRVTSRRVAALIRAAVEAVPVASKRAVARRPKVARPRVAQRPTVPARPPATVALPELAGGAPAIVFCTIEGECEIRLFRGYVKSQFVAVELQDNGTAGRALAESPWFRWPKTGSLASVPEIVTAHEQLVEALARRGWVRYGRGSEWYSDRLERVVA